MKGRISDLFKGIASQPRIRRCDICGVLFSLTEQASSAFIQTESTEELQYMGISTGRATVAF